MGNIREALLKLLQVVEPDDIHDIGRNDNLIVGLREIHDGVLVNNFSSPVFGIRRVVIEKGLRGLRSHVEGE